MEALSACWKVFKIVWCILNLCSEMSIRLWGPDGFLGGRRVQTQTGTRRWGPAIPGALSSFWRARGRLAGFHRAPMVILGQNQPRISPQQLVVCVAMNLPAVRRQRQVGSWIVISRKFDLGFWIWIIFSIPVFDRRCPSHQLASCKVQRQRTALPAAGGRPRQRQRQRS